MSSYDQVFYEYVNRGAIRSAEIVLPHLFRHLAIGSVLDVGCGQGAWLSVCARLGVPEVTGIDGDYVSRQQLLIPPERFVACDLAAGFRLAGHFDLVMSLEVAEHLPPERSAAFVEALVGHGEMVLFSAAPPGQGGHNHVNERDYDDWRRLFARRGYVGFDCLRPLIRHERRVEPWYRYNPILYVAAGRVERLPEEIRRCRLAEDAPIRDLSPAWYRARKRLVRLLPPRWMTWIASCKERFVAGRPA